jgi:hypothetical protein
MNPLAAITPTVRPSGFSKIPLEIREEIYRMLLTTPYCMFVDSARQCLRFCLHTAILRVNKQVSAESTRILYEENQFIILKVSLNSFFPQEIPAFNHLSENKVKNPLLSVEIVLEIHGASCQIIRSLASQLLMDFNLS